MGAHDPTVASFSAIARDPAALRAFLGSIGDAHAPSRLRAARVLDASALILDVGAGPGTTFHSFANARCDEVRRLTGGRRWRYLGVEAVHELALAGAGIDVAFPFSFGEVHDSVVRLKGDNIDPPLGRGRLVVMPALGFLQSCPRGVFDGVVIRHVLEHQPDPFPLLHAASEVVVPGGRIFVALSQDTHTKGPPRPLQTDAHLGARRWSHHRPTLDRALCIGDGRQWKLVDHARGIGDGLIVREEAFAWERTA